MSERDPHYWCSNDFGLIDFGSDFTVPHNVGGNDLYNPNRVGIRFDTQHQKRDTVRSAHNPGKKQRKPRSWEYPY